MIGNIPTFLLEKGSMVIVKIYDGKFSANRVQFDQFAPNTAHFAWRALLHQNKNKCPQK